MILLLNIYFLFKVQRFLFKICWTQFGAQISCLLLLNCLFWFIDQVFLHCVIVAVLSSINCLLILCFLFVLFRTQNLITRTKLYNQQFIFQISSLILSIAFPFLFTQFRSASLPFQGILSSAASETCYWLNSNFPLSTNLGFWPTG